MKSLSYRNRRAFRKTLRASLAAHFKACVPGDIRTALYTALYYWAETERAHREKPQLQIKLRLLRRRLYRRRRATPDERREAMELFLSARAYGQGTPDGSWPQLLSVRR